MSDDVMLFDEKTHKYSSGGVVYTSTTQLLKKYGLSANYANIPAQILQKAAQKGNAVHKALELYIGGDQSMLGLVEEVDLFHNYVQLQGLDLLMARSEEIVYDHQYKIAGTIDFQYQDGNDTIIADFKTTSSLHLDSVAWQLSIYNYLVCKGDVLTYYFNKLKVFHFVNGRMYVKDVYTVDYDAVKGLFEANLRNDPVFIYVKSTKLISDTDEVLVGQLLNELDIYEGAVKKIKGELSNVMSRVKENMLTQKDYAVRTPVFALTYIGEQHRKTINTKKVKEYLINQGENIDDYFNETIVADTVRPKLLKSKTTVIEAQEKEDI